MAVETFRYIEYSDSDKFIRQNDRIELREYSEDLLFYADFDSTTNAKYSVGDDTGTIIGTAANENNGVFAQHLHIQNGSVAFNSNNFTNLTETGTLKFRLKTNFNNAMGSQEFVRTDEPFITSVPDIDTSSSRFGGASLDLRGAEEKRVEYDVSNISTMVQSGTIDFFFLTDYTGTPSNRIVFFDAYNGVDNINRIQIFHDTDGNLYFHIYDQAGTLSVNISFAWTADNSWHNLAFSYDLNAGDSRAFIDGIQYGTTDTTTATRTALGSGYFAVGSDASNLADFRIDDFAIFDSSKFTSNYAVRNVAYTITEPDVIVHARYDTTVDLNIGAVTAPIQVIPVSSAYEFKLAVDGVYYTGGDISVNLDTDDTMTDVFNKVALAVSGADVVVTQETEGNIKITGNLMGQEISIEEPDTGRSLIQLLDGVEDAILPNGPTSDTIIAEFYNGTNNQNRITFTHTSSSNLILNMYDSSGTLVVNQDFGVWSNSSIYWYAFTLVWNKTIGQFYIDGQQIGVFSTGFTRGSNTQFFLRAGTDFYRFDEVIVYNTYKHTMNYTVETAPLTPYAADDPYIDIYFGSGFKEDQVKDLNLNASIGTNYVVKIDNTYFYYYSSAWRESDGSYSESVSPSVMETKFSELYFHEDQELVIRVYFHSDGLTEVWLDEIAIVLETTSESAATIIGTVDISGGVDLSSDQHVTISTDQGSQEVDLSTEVPAQPAEHIGTADLSSGYNWASLGAETFEVNGATINLNADTADLNDVISLIEPQLPTGVEVFADGNNIGLRTTDLGPAATLDLVELAGGLARLGMTDDTYTGDDPDLTTVTADQIIDAINAANVPGLATATLSPDGYIVLQSTNTGTDAYVSIAEGSTSDALPIVWGYESTDSGEEPAGTFFDYSTIYDWIRSMLGAPVVPVELTDEQLENCVGRAVFWYNYYREAKEKLLYTSLVGSEGEGYEIPQEVGGEKNIIELVLRPRFPFAYYTGGDVNNIMSNLYLQWMFQRGRNTDTFKDFIGDYYITLSTEQDFNIILGTQVKWNFYNGKVFIQPPPIGLDVGIIFKSAVTVEEINTNSLIRSYALGEAKQVLGQIRATFGSQIPGGTENIQLRGEALIAEGKEEVQAALDKMMKLTEPLFLEWG